MSFDISKRLIIESIGVVIGNNGNSYINSYTEKYLKDAEKLGCYQGRFQGHFLDIEQEWYDFINGDDSEVVYDRIKKGKK